jgi:TetR/AcrR family transcriptional regulator
MEVKVQRKRIKDSKKSKEDILKAAEQEFSDKGLYGTRVDEIAKKANINKRMIYEYFGSKENLYKSVLVEVYSRLSQMEIKSLANEGTCTQKIRNIIQTYFEFLRDNPSFVSMVLWENLNKARYFNELNIKAIKDPTIDFLRRIIAEGKQNGSFRSEIDADQIIFSLLTYTFSYYSNRYTMSKLMQKKLDDEKNIQKRIDNVVDMFLKYMCSYDYTAKAHSTE